MEYLCNYWSDLSQILNLGFYDQGKPFKCFKWRRLQMEDDLKWKTTSITKSGISLQLLVGSVPNFKLRLLWPNMTKSKLFKCFKCRRFQMEDELKWKITLNGRLPQILNVKYLSNYWSDHSEILNLSLYDQKQIFQMFQMKTILNGRWAHMEDYLKF